MNRRTFPVILILDNIRSLFNVGSIFRSADAAGVERIILSRFTAAPPRHEIEKTALGATRTVPWKQVDSLVAYIEELREKGYRIAALEQTETSQNIFQTGLAGPLALIVGHEREGVEDEILNLCDVHLEIPMHGTSAHSLNVSNATAVALYELRRQFEESR